MRDILFRAKLKDTNYWAEGFYCSMRETTYCCEEDYKRHPVPLHHLIAVDEMTDWGLPNRLRLYEINPETLCQYTGLCDKNGKKIFEGDILRGFQYPFCYDGEYNYYAEIIFVNCSFMTYTHKNPLSYVVGISDGNTELMECWVSEDWEVIGNIYDNPELLEDENEKT